MSKERDNNNIPSQKFEKNEIQNESTNGILETNNTEQSPDLEHVEDKIRIEEVRQELERQYLLADEHHEALPSRTQIADFYIRKDRETTRKSLRLGFKVGFGYIANVLGSMRSFGQKNTEDIMGFLNGEDTRFLANKYNFVEETKKLGYNNELQQILLQHGQPEEITRNAIKSAFPDENTLVFLKQFGVGKGRGIDVMPVNTLIRNLSNIKEDRIVQNKVDVARAFRAVLVDDPENNTVVEHYFEAHLPVVTGDGRKNIRELLSENTEIPKDSKRKLLKHMDVPLQYVPGETQRVNLGYVGHDTHGGYYSTPDEASVKNVRKFAASLKADLEQKYGHSIPVFCIDLAAMDDQILSEDFDPEEAKKRFVAFELQMGFDPGFDKLSTYPRFLAMLPMVRKRN